MHLKIMIVGAALLALGCRPKTPTSDCANRISACLESCESGRAAKDDYSTSPSAQRNPRTPCEQVCYRRCSEAASPTPATIQGTTPEGATPTGAAPDPMPTPEPPPLQEPPTPTAEP